MASGGPFLGEGSIVPQGRAGSGPFREGRRGPLAHLNFRSVIARSHAVRTATKQSRGSRDLHPPGAMLVGLRRY